MAAIATQLTSTTASPTRTSSTLRRRRDTASDRHLAQRGRDSDATATCLVTPCRRHSSSVSFSPIRRIDARAARRRDPRVLRPCRLSQLRVVVSPTPSRRAISSMVKPSSTKGSSSPRVRPLFGRCCRAPRACKPNLWSSLSNTSDRKIQASRKAATPRPAPCGLCARPKPRVLGLGRRGARSRRLRQRRLSGTRDDAAPAGGS